MADLVGVAEARKCGEEADPRTGAEGRLLTDLAGRLVPVARALLSPGEQLTGCCVATWQKPFSGRMVAIAVAPERIVVQALTRRFEAAGEPIPFPRDRLSRVSVRHGIGGSVSLPSVLMESVSITIDLVPVDGSRIRLLLMGSGGQVQHEGIAALLSYLEPAVEGSG